VQGPILSSTRDAVTTIREPIDDHKRFFFQVYDVTEIEIICGDD
jgi:hypothetical protein